ncbi:MAG: hypothetical protein OJF60_001082 [Burkholderiaceae bacterium]|jgi:hypothetical protein|nr:MAG: hypothetical protein OJF60_001082 [Burkholderiaceae bacterium]
MNGSPTALTGAAALAAAMIGSLANPPHPPGAALKQWDFTVLLDGRIVGTHRFTLAEGTGDAPGRNTLTSEARFDVKLLGLTVYRYRFDDREQWDGNCLASIFANTDDNGRLTEVVGRQTDGGFSIEVKPAVAKTAPRAGPDARTCLMSFAYWNPALKTQQRLLNPATGRVQAVSFAPLPATEIEVHKEQTLARGLRIDGLAHPIDVWYVGDEWVGLNTAVDGGRQLSYRLQ